MRFISAILVFIFAIQTCQATRIKDITSLAGIRENQLVGYGLVVGLDGTGDRTAIAPFTEQSFRNMLLQFGVRMPQGDAMQLRNVAAVAVSAKLPPFARIGQKIDITVSSLGNAPSLRGGTLLMIPLRGADNQIYAMAQGNVVISGFGARGQDGSKVTVNTTATGLVPEGATVEKTIEMPYMRDGMIVFELNQPDFTTSQRIAETINQELGYTAAQPMDAGAVAVKLNNKVRKDDFLNHNAQVNFISDLENLPVHPGTVAAKVIVNARSGTIVVGQDVSISPVAVMHGNLTVAVTEDPNVSQPNAFSQGKTVVTKNSSININQQKAHAFVLKPGASLKNLVDAINHAGAAPGDLIEILQAIKQAGALHAELEVI